MSIMKDDCCEGSEIGLKKSDCAAKRYVERTCVMKKHGDNKPSRHACPDHKCWIYKYMREFEKEGK